SSAPVTHATIGDPQSSTAEQLVDVPTLAVANIDVVAPRMCRVKKAAFALLGIAIVFAAAIGYGLYWALTRQPKQFGQVKMTALTTGGRINGEDINGQLSISPDGKYVVFA